MKNKKVLLGIIFFVLLLVLFVIGILAYGQFIVKLNLNNRFLMGLFIIPVVIVAIFLILLKYKILGIPFIEKKKDYIYVAVGIILSLIIILTGLILESYKIIDMKLSMRIVAFACMIFLLGYGLIEHKKKSKKDTLLILTYFYPGLGQIFLGKVRRGIAILVSFTIAIGLSLFLIFYTKFEATEKYALIAQPYSTYGWILLFLTVALALWAIKDAFNISEEKTQAVKH